MRTCAWRSSSRTCLELFLQRVDRGLKLFDLDVADTDLLLCLFEFGGQLCDDDLTLTNLFQTERHLLAAGFIDLILDVARHLLLGLIRFGGTALVFRFVLRVQFITQSAVGINGSDEMLECHHVVHILLNVLGHLTLKDVFLENVTGLAVALDKHPQIIALLERGILLDAVGLVDRRLDRDTALERFNQLGADEVVELHTDTLDTLVVGQSGEFLFSVDLIALMLLSVVVYGETEFLVTDHHLAIHVDLTG